MKNILIAATIVGAVVAGAIIYMTNYAGPSNKLEDAADDVGDAAHDALNTMNKSLHRIERKTDPVLN